MKVKGVVVGVGEMNQGREISMEEAAALVSETAHLYLCFSLFDDDDDSNTD